MTSHQSSQLPQYDRIVREKERKQITGISRAHAFQLERNHEYPRRVRLGNRSVGWRYSELLAWINSRQIPQSQTGGVGGAE